MPPGKGVASAPGEHALEGLKIDPNFTGDSGTGFRDRN
jgi:hypothetical protein